MLLDLWGLLSQALQAPKAWGPPADAGSQLVEHYGYRTDIMTSYDGSEQRVQLRSLPLVSLQFTTRALEPRISELLASLIFGLEEEALLMPLWQYGSRLTSAVAAGGQLFAIPDAQLCPYQVGGRFLVWRDAFFWEVHHIDSFGPTGVQAAEVAVAAWPAGSVVFPAMTGRITEQLRLEHDAAGVSSAVLMFTADQT